MNNSIRKCNETDLNDAVNFADGNRRYTDQLLEKDSILCSSFINSDRGDNENDIYKFENISCLSKCSEVFERDNCFLRGCKWAPNDACIVVNASDHKLRFFLLPDELQCWNFGSEICQFPELNTAAYIKPGGIIHDFNWCPINTSISELRLLIASSLGPIQLWDVCHGDIESSYQMYDDKDEVINGISVTCSPKGDTIYAGTTNSLYIFDADRPGRDSYVIKDKAFKKGMISTIAVNPTRESLLAIGTYSKYIGMYDERALLCIFSGLNKGITQLKFSPDGMLLYCGMRGDGDIICYDLRKLGCALFKMCRIVNTQQRIYFDLTPDGRYLISGSTDGRVFIWDTLRMPVNDTLLPIKEFYGNLDCTNGVSINESLPILATASGQYHRTFEYCDSSSDSSDSQDATVNNHNIQKEYALKLWLLGK